MIVSESQRLTTSVMTDHSWYIDVQVESQVKVSVITQTLFQRLLT